MCVSCGMAPKKVRVVSYFSWQARERLAERTDRFSTISLICGDLLAATAARNAYDVMDFQETAPILQELPSATVAQDFSSTLE